MPRAVWQLFGTGIDGRPREEQNDVTDSIETPLLDAQPRDRGDGNVDDVDVVMDFEDEDEEDVEDEEEDDDERSELVDVDEIAEDGLSSEDENEQCTESIQHLIRGSFNRVLVTLVAACLARDSKTAFRGRTWALDDDAKIQARAIFDYNKYCINTLFFCNQCGARLERSRNCNCGGITAKYIRMPMKEQIENIVQFNFDEIRKVREMLRNGQAESHNLSSPFFRQLPEMEPDQAMFLSLLGSVDGVSLHGHNKNKIWPICFEIIDLPSALMQKAENLILGGIVECRVNPSTALWNSIMNVVFLDVECCSFSVNGITCTAFVVSFVADQPAKRGLFGMKSCNSSLSCFYCLDEGTLYKWSAEARSLYRPNKLTENDAKAGVNGFGKVYSEVIEHVMPYDTPIDLLHNCGEGLLNQISKEILPLKLNQKRKTDLFICDTEALEKHLKEVSIRTDFKSCITRRNGTNKQDFFRIYLLESCLCSDILNSKARIIVIGLSLLMHKMYTGAGSAENFLSDVCTSLQEFFREDNHKYLAMKAHELLFHLPEVYEKFGSSYYRFLVHTSSRREILRRWKAPGCSNRIRGYMAETPHLQPRVTSYNSKIHDLKDEDKLNNPLGFPIVYYSVYTHSAGRLVSFYQNPSTKDDIFFVKNCANVRCARFVAFVVSGSERNLLVEPVEEKAFGLRFQSLDHLALDFNGVTKLHFSRILRHLKEFRGIVDGKMSGRRILLSEDSFDGVGVVFKTQLETYYVQLNGLPVHA